MRIKLNISQKVPIKITESLVLESREVHDK